MEGHRGIRCYLGASLAGAVRRQKKGPAVADPFGFRKGYASP